MALGDRVRALRRTGLSLGRVAALLGVTPEEANASLTGAPDPPSFGAGGVASAWGLHAPDTLVPVTADGPPSEIEPLFVVPIDIPHHAVMLNVDFEVRTGEDGQQSSVEFVVVEATDHAEGVTIASLSTQITNDEWRRYTCNDWSDAGFATFNSVISATPGARSYGLVAWTGGFPAGLEPARLRNTRLGVMPL